MDADTTYTSNTVRRRPPRTLFMTARPFPHLFQIDDCNPPYDFVEVRRQSTHPLVDRYRGQVLLHTVHDGKLIPRRFLCRGNKPTVDLDELDRLFIRERDWGANLIAGEIASAANIPGYARCRLARVLMDFNRFPGTTPPGGRGLETLAISEPFASALSHPEKLSLLEDYYDSISELIEDSLLSGKLIMIAVHTYDEHNPSRTQRSDLSLLTRMAHYQRESRMPYGVFDPMFPDALGASTCSRVLRDRISLNLERSGFRVSHNHPYPLPEGSMEVRAQVWYFFDYLRKRFQDSHPESRDDPAYQLVWLMLLNTNLRLQDAEALRSFLHRFRRVPRTQLARFKRAEKAYTHVGEFLDGGSIALDFRTSKQRASSLGLEVRKDLICSFDPQTGRPLPITEAQREKARFVGEVIASAIATYFETDRQIL